MANENCKSLEDEGDERRHPWLIDCVPRTGMQREYGGTLGNVNLSDTGLIDHYM